MKEAGDILRRGSNTRYLETGAADELHPVAAPEGRNLRRVVVVVVAGDAYRPGRDDA